MKKQLYLSFQKIWKGRYIIGTTLILAVILSNKNPDGFVYDTKTMIIVAIGSAIAATYVAISELRKDINERRRNKNSN